MRRQAWVTVPTTSKRVCATKTTSASGCSGDCGSDAADARGQDIGHLVRLPCQFLGAALAEVVDCRHAPAEREVVALREEHEGIVRTQPSRHRPDGVD